MRLFKVNLSLQYSSGLFLEGLSIFLIFAALTVAVAQLVRASDCDSEGRGFEPHQSPNFFFPRLTKYYCRLPFRRCLMA